MNLNELINVEISRTLAHTALLAAWDGDGEAANEIFTALYKAKPKEPNVRICQAMVLACQERFKECTALLLNIISETPDNLNAKSLLGMVKFYINEDGWRSLLEEVVADGSDEAAVQMASNLLTEYPSILPQAPRPTVGGYMAYA